MNKAELIERIAADCDLRKTTVELMLNGLGDAVAEALAHGDEVTLPGLGKLKTTTRTARTGRNPQTGGAIEIPARITVKFIAAKALKDTVS